MKICQLASYNKNIGDNAAIYNIRSFFSNVEWNDYDLNNFYEIKNQINKSIEMLTKLNDSNDAFLLGGGGLIEGGIYNNFDTGWKLPFNKQTLKVITKPIFCVALGVNYFRGIEKLNKTGVENLKLLIEKSSFFSVRNDGSAEILKSLGIKNFVEIPDPGLIFSKNKNRQKKMLKGMFQPAMNLTPRINQYRDLTVENLSFLETFCKENNLISLPHTPKDYLFFNSVKNCVEKDQLMNLLKKENYSESLKFYEENDYCIAMRGHGQLISCGLNVPSLYLSTQNKVLGYGVKNGYKKFMIDTYDKNWKQKLLDRHKTLIQSNDFINEWYEINESNIVNYRKTFKEAMEHIKSSLA